MHKVAVFSNVDLIYNIKMIMNPRPALQYLSCSLKGTLQKTIGTSKIEKCRTKSPLWTLAKVKYSLSNQKWVKTSHVRTKTEIYFNHPSL